MGDLQAKPPARRGPRYVRSLVANVPGDHHADPPGLAHGGRDHPYSRPALRHETEPPGVGDGRAGGLRRRPEAPGLLLAPPLGRVSGRRRRRALCRAQTSSLARRHAVRSPLGVVTRPRLAGKCPPENREVTDSLLRGHALFAAHRPPDLALLRDVRRRAEPW